MMKWIISGLLLILLALAAYCFSISRGARKVVVAVNGPPLIQQQIDFSKPFTNEFNFHHTVQPLYGMIYLTLKADPWSKHWTNADIASEELREARGQIRIYQSNNVPVNERPLNWFYGSTVVFHIPNQKQPLSRDSLAGYL
jgi:hypothetical protein